MVIGRTTLTEHFVNPECSQPTNSFIQAQQLLEQPRRAQPWLLAWAQCGVAGQKPAGSVEHLISVRLTLAPACSTQLVLRPLCALNKEEFIM